MYAHRVWVLGILRLGKWTTMAQTNMKIESTEFKFISTGMFNPKSMVGLKNC